MGSIRAKVREGWGQFVGPEATRKDNAGTVGLALVGAALAPALLRHRRPARMAELALTSGLAFDLWGGAWANNTLACARWYERPGQTDTAHLLFASLHIHPFAVAWLDRNQRRSHSGSVWAAAHYSYRLGATTIIRRFPVQRRPLGVALTLGGLLLDYWFRPSQAAPWFAVTYYPKLLMGHAAASLWTDDELDEMISL